MNHAALDQRTSPAWKHRPANSLRRSARRPPPHHKPPVVERHPRYPRHDRPRARAEAPPASRLSQQERAPRRVSPLVIQNSETETASGRRFLELYGGTGIARPHTAGLEPVEETNSHPAHPTTVRLQAARAG